MPLPPNAGFHLRLRRALRRRASRAVRRSSSARSVLSNVAKSFVARESVTLGDATAANES